VSTGIASTGLIKPQAFNATFSAFGETNSATYVGTINVGNITGRALHFAETLISASSYVILKSSDGTGWYYADGAKDTLVYTGFTSSGLFTVSTLTSTTGFYTGQLITGNTIGAGARVSSINIAASTIGLTVANTANSTGALITKEPIAKILDANFRASVTYISAFAPMDGYHFYATDDGYINNSDLNTITTYGANNRLAVQQSPDPAIAVAVQNNSVVVFGTGSNEKFQNAGLATGSPLQRIAQAAERIGCIDQRSVTQIEDDIYYVASPSEGDVGVYRMRGLRSTRISTPTMDRILGTVFSNGAIYAQSYRLGGQAYAKFVLSQAADGPSSQLLLESGDAILLESGDHILLEDTPAQTASFVRALVYNVNLNIWSEQDDVVATFIDSFASGTNNQLIATSRFKTDGKVYKIDPVSAGATYQDDTSTYAMEIRTSKIDFGTANKKYIREVELIADTVSSGTAQLYISDDDYATWQGPFTFDMTKMRKNVTRLGAHYGGRAYKVVHSSNAYFRGEALNITYTEGLS
jgi:hypothetical protein